MKKDITLFGSICSIFGLIISIYLFIENRSIDFLQWFILGFVILTIASVCAYFYIKSQNSITKTIDKYRISKDASEDNIESDLSNQSNKSFAKIARDRVNTDSLRRLAIEKLTDKRMLASVLAEIAEDRTNTDSLRRLASERLFKIR